MQFIRFIVGMSPPSPHPIFATFHRPSALPVPLVIIGLLGLSASIAVQAETLIDLRDRQLYEFEQCASSCQVELDSLLVRCPEPSDDSDSLETQVCRNDVREFYRKCLAMCPADPRPIGTDASI
jgi:hypothetical protein